MNNMAQLVGYGWSSETLMPAATAAVEAFATAWKTAAARAPWSSMAMRAPTATLLTTSACLAAHGRDCHPLRAAADLSVAAHAQFYPRAGIVGDAASYPAPPGGSHGVDKKCGRHS